RYGPSRGPVVPSTFAWIWGWASWQRAWRDYRFDLADTWPNSVTSAGVRDYLRNDLNFLAQTNNFDALAQGSVDTWDYQWSFALLSRRRVNLISTVNLVTNLGFDGDATHTTQSEPYLRDLATHALVPTRRHRDITAPDRAHDKLFGEILHARSWLKITRLRLLASQPVLAALVLGV
ncbi:MAG: hypothetical protein H7067_05495, partial [Burkholderiales bacterium]|nr:hypothetical protein [Opitutaceae bacterium]